MLLKRLITSTLAWVSHLEQDPPLVGKSGVGVERFVDFHLQGENLIRCHVPSHHSAIWVSVHLLAFRNVAILLRYVL